MLTFLRLLKIVFSRDWKRKKMDYRIYPHVYWRVNCGSLAWFWEKLGVNPNELFHTQYRNLKFGILVMKDLVNLRWKRASSFQYQIAEFFCQDKFRVEALAWRKSGCNRLVKMSSKLRFLHILVIKTFYRSHFVATCFI